MSAPDKLRGGKESELVNLKAKWRVMSDDARSYWSELFASQTSQAEIRKEILTKLKIHLRWDKQLTYFRQWLEAQEQRELMAEKIEERKHELLAGGMTLEQAQEVLLTEASAYSVAARDFKLGVKVSSEISKKTVAALDQEKFKEGLRKKLQTGLDAVAEAFKSNPEAVKLYKQARALIEREMK